MCMGGSKYATYRGNPHKFLRKSTHDELVTYINSVMHVSTLSFRKAFCHLQDNFTKSKLISFRNFLGLASLKDVDEWIFEESCKDEGDAREHPRVHRLHVRNPKNMTKNVTTESHSPHRCNLRANKVAYLGSMALMLFIWVEIVRTVSSPTLIRAGTAATSIQKDDHEMRTTKKLGAYTCQA